MCNNENKIAKYWACDFHFVIKKKKLIKMDYHVLKIKLIVMDNTNVIRFFFMRRQQKLSRNVTVFL